MDITFKMAGLKHFSQSLMIPEWHDMDAVMLTFRNRAGHGPGHCPARQYVHTDFESPPVRFTLDEWIVLRWVVDISRTRDGWEDVRGTVR